MGDAQGPGDAHHLFHRIIGGANDARGQEQPLDIIAPIEFDRQPDDLFGGKPCSFDIAGGAIDAIGAVIDAEIGHQDFQEGNAAPVRGIGMADSGAFGRAQPAACGRIPFRRAARCAGGIIFGGVGQDGKTILQRFPHYLFTICSLSMRQAIIAEIAEKQATSREKLRRRKRALPVRLRIFWPFRPALCYNRSNWFVTWFRSSASEPVSFCVRQ